MNNPIFQAIRTTYHGPTDHRGARITAKSGSGLKVTIPYPHELNSHEAHRLAAQTLCAKLGWKQPLAQGSLADSDVFVLLN